MAEDTAILDFRDLHMLCILKNLILCFYEKEPAIKNSKAMPGHEKVKISDLAEEARLSMVILEEFKCLEKCNQ